MKKNAILIAGILCVAGASQAQEESSDRYRSGQYDTLSESGSYSEDISADSSIRGGTLDARGYLQDANNNEIEGVPNPINPGTQADSSIRGGSIFAREREWNHDMEPSSGKTDHKRHLKADSSIRGGSLEARGAREAKMHREQVNRSYQPNLNQTWDHSGEGSSATFESDRDIGAVTSSPNWNSSDDLLRDGVDAEATGEYERNNDASVEGAVTAESGSATLEGVELDYHYSPATPQSELSAKHELNSSDQLEKNISGEFDINSPEATADLNSTESDLSSDIERENREAVGAAATSESESSSSSYSTDYNSSFESKDPALKSADTPLKEGDIDFIYRDNRAHGVGSLSTGEFGAVVATQSAAGLESDERLSQEVKGRLTRESTEANATMKSDVVRNVQVSANNGEVTLSGTVPSEKDKQMIEIRAAEMPGVKSVKNELTVTPEADAGIRSLNRTSEFQD